MGRRTGTVEDTATRALDVAERLVQTRGFNGFSYADIAKELGITKAALHYHYASKADLGQALIDRYRLRFGDLLVGLDRSGQSADAKLRSYVDIYRQVLVGGRMCLCGMLAAEHELLPVPMREAVAAFFADNEVWLVGVLTQGQADGTLRLDSPPLESARALVGGLEGAMMIARLRDDKCVFEAAAERLVRDLVSVVTGAAADGAH